MPLIRAPRFSILALLASSVFCSTLAAASTGALDARQRDPSTAACMDFYQHANGGWLASTPVPPGLGSFGYTDEVRADIATRQRELLAAFGSAPDGALEASIARLYALGMDSAGIEAAGLGPAAGFLKRIDELAKPKELPLLISEFHVWGAPILFSFTAGADPQSQKVIAYVNQGGLGLPDRDYYLRGDPTTLELRGAYQAYVERLLALSGRPAAAAEAEAVLRMETELAHQSLAIEQLRDPANSYRPTALRELEKGQPNLRWKDYLRAQGVRGADTVSQAHVSFFNAVNGMLATTPLADWQAYLRFHVLHAAAPFLGEAFVSAHDQLYQVSLAGRAAPEREPRVLQLMQRGLGDALGQRFASRQLDPARREAALAMVEALRAQLRQRVSAAEWMSEEGRAALLADVDTLVFALGGPTQTPWEGWTLEANTYADAVLSMSRYGHQQDLARIGKPSTPRWPVPPTALQAVYDPSSNTLYVPAGLLQDPLFNPSGDSALNFGAAGVLVGRSLAAAFDPASGPRRGRVLESDRQAFASRGEGLISQYSAFTALGALNVDGAATWAENIADLVGLELAYGAWAAAAGETGENLDGLSPAQRFHLGWARLQRRNYLDEVLRLQLASDLKSPARFRVNGPLPHLPAFHAAFSCTEGSPMFLPEAARAHIW